MALRRPAAGVPPERAQRTGDDSARPGAAACTGARGRRGAARSSTSRTRPLVQGPRVAIAAAKASSSASTRSRRPRQGTSRTPSRPGRRHRHGRSSSARGPRAEKFKATRSTAPRSTPSREARRLLPPRRRARRRGRPGFVNVNLAPTTPRIEDARVRDHGATPLGDSGCGVITDRLRPMFTKVWKASSSSAGLVSSRHPRGSYGGEAEGCSPVGAAFADDRRVRRRPELIASSLAIGVPADGDLGIATAGVERRDLLGPEEEVGENMALLAGTPGVFGEGARASRRGARGRCAERSASNDRWSCQSWAWA